MKKKGSQKETTILVLNQTAKEALVSATGGIEKVRRRRSPVAKSSCFQGGQAQSDCARDVEKFREMKGLGILMELYPER